MSIIVTGVHGCCGASNWYLERNRKASKSFKEELVQKIREEARGAVSLHLTTTQRNKLKNVLEHNGFVECWGPIKNPNTNANIYGFILDVKKAKKALPKEKSVFSYGGYYL